MWRGRPDRIRCDNGPEYVSAPLMAWAYRRGIHVEFIQPGKPQQNAYIERYNRTVRYDWLAHYLFDSIDEVQAYATRCPTWPSVASHPTRTWPWPHSLYSQAASKMEGLPYQIWGETDRSEKESSAALEDRRYFDDHQSRNMYGTALKNTFSCLLSFWRLIEFLSSAAADPI
jgi:hypothetical protein